MKWSWRIARVAGIGIYIHATFPLLLAYVALIQYRDEPALLPTLLAIGIVLLIFVIVVLHELGHAFMARRFGIATRDITLLPIGGIARLERMPRDPKQELLIALAGPAVNVVLAGLFLVGFLAAGGTPSARAIAAAEPQAIGRALLRMMLQVNVILAVFNLIPAFPMDGGRVLRAVVALRTGNYARATEIAANVGRFFALVFGIVGLFWWEAPLLVLVAVFVWLGAASEAAAVETSSSLAGVPVSRVMITDVRTVAPADPLARAVRLTLDGFQQDFPVVDESGTVVGVLTRRALFQALAERGAEVPVAEVMRREFRVAEPGEPVEEALTRLRESEGQVMPVVRGRELIGVLTVDNVGEYVMVQTALRQAGA